MKREIKFRAWHRESEQMSHAFTLFDITDGFIVFEEDPYTFGYEDDVIVMQFTGVKDEEVEIYEGDIIEVEDHFEGDCYQKGGIYQIAFDEGEFFATSIRDEFMSLFDAFKNYGAKIIGNIYQNKDLLKSK